MTDSKFCEHGVNVGLENPPVFCGQCPPDTITKLRADLASVRLDYANECDRARRAEARHERDKDELRADLARVTKERDEARANACRCADDESCRRVREGREAVARAERAEKERDAELASLRNEVSRLSALSTAHSQIADAWKARAARDAKTIGRISRLVGPPRCEACIREGRYTPCIECPEPGTPSGWVSGGGTSEVK